MASSSCSATARLASFSISRAARDASPPLFKSIAATTVSTFAPPARSGWAKPAVRPDQSEKLSASAFRAPPTRSFVFTSAGIPSLVDRSGSFAPSGATNNRLSDQSDLPSRLHSRSRVQIRRASFFAHCCLGLFLAQSALVRFESSLSALKIVPQNLVQFLRSDRFREIPVHSYGQAFLPIPPFFESPRSLRTHPSPASAHP